MSKLKEIFKNGWYPILEDHLHSHSFKELSYNIKSFIDSNIAFSPRTSDVFRAFQECPWDNLHTVILGLDPYPGIVKGKNQYVADGLAFSSRYSDVCPKSLDLIRKAIEVDVFDGLWLDAPINNFDLTHWANQGILLLNTALTYPIGQKSGAHFELWKPFITYVLQEINARKNSVGVILMGKMAQSYKSLFTNESFAIYTCSHPASAAYTGGKWDHSECFRALTGFHKSINNINIKF